MLESRNQQFPHLKIVNGGVELFNCDENLICEEKGLPDHAAENEWAKRSQVARLLITGLNEKFASYCILTGYEDLPAKVNTDIDFVVGYSDFKRVPAFLDEIAVKAGASLFQVIPHEATGRAFLVAAQDNGNVSFVQPDSCADYRHFGKLWLYSDELLGSRQQHDRGFWIPSASSEFIYYLIKRINKSDITATHQSKLSRLYMESPCECNLWLNRFWGRRSAKSLAEMAETSNWSELVKSLSAYRREMMKHSRRTFSFATEASHTLERISNPTGGWIAFIGPDGCGKSAVIEAIAADFAPAFQKVVRRHFRPKALPGNKANGVPVTNPHGRPVRGTIYSVMKLLYLFLDYSIGHFIRVRSDMVRTKLVIFDRYFYDILIDPERILYGGPKWLPKLLSHFVPVPEITFLLSAPPDVLWSRKQEVPYEEVVRQQREFLDLARGIPGAIVIDASCALQEVRLQVQKAIIEYYSRRTRRRMKLDARSKIEGVC